MKPRPEFKYGLTMSVIGFTLTWHATNGFYWYVLLWPGLSFLVVSFCYFTNTTQPFGKRSDGTRNPLAKLVLGPYLALTRLTWELQLLFIREVAFNRVNSRLIVARRLKLRELPEEVTCVCDLTCELLDPQEYRVSREYRCFPILDAGAPSGIQLAQFARELVSKNHDCLLIHCANGHGRTGMVSAAWLIATGHATSVEDSLKQLKSARPGISLRKQQLGALKAAATHLREHQTGE